jgi:hypothetical protein
MWSDRLGWQRPGKSYITTHFSTPPTVETLATTNVETGPKIQKYRSRQTLREDVHELGGHRNVQDANITDGNMFSDEVNVDLDMLRTLVLNRVGGGVDDAYVVTVDESALGQRSMELLEELLEPTSFSHAVGPGTIHSLGALTGRRCSGAWRTRRRGCHRGT